mmetsp:Transcript_20437/g.18571  ORF Transcript_20437/g.18571 Transcript_20437/m.18571 type:complete len:179 (+) Transcript_20437:3-539(+)
MTTVAEEGNRRIGEMSNDEIKQCIIDIKSWFNRYNKKNTINNQIIAATSVDFQRLSKAIDTTIPNSFKILLSEADSEIYLLDKKLLSSNEIIEFSNQASSLTTWNNDFIPICGDISSAFIINGRTNKVYEWDEDNGVGDLLASTFSEYLETYRNMLLSGKYEYVSSVGVIEKCAPSRK